MNEQKIRGVKPLLWWICLVFAVGCSKPEVIDPASFPSVTLLDDGGALTKNQTIAEGSIVKFHFTAAKGATNLALVRVTMTDGAAAPKTLFEQTLDAPDFSKVLNDTLPNKSGSVVYLFYAEDKKGNHTSRSVTLAVADLSQIVPSITPTFNTLSPDGLFKPGDSIRYTVNIAKHPLGGKIKNYTFNLYLDGSSDPYFPYGKADLDSTVVVDTFYTTLPNVFTEWKEVYTAEAADGKIKTLEITREFTYISPCRKFANITLGAQLNTEGGGFFGSDSGRVYTYEDAKGKADSVDIIYYYTELEKATLAGPSDEIVKQPPPTGVFPDGTQVFNPLNETRFKIVPSYMLSPLDFSKLNLSLAGDRINKLWDDLAPNPLVTRLNGLTNGTIISFLTNKGKRGVLLVKRITTGESGTMVCDVIIKD